MDGRGRKSQAALSVVQGGALVNRVAAPDGLTPAQAERWVRIVNEQPADWFNESTAPVLSEYVRAVSMCDLLSQQIESAIAGGDATEIKAFLDMRDKESKRVASLATKLRLTQQSRYTPRAAGSAGRTSAKPWLTE